MIDMISITIALAFVFVPALLLSALLKFTPEAFLGFIAVFMFLGALPTFAVLPEWFTFLSIFLGVVLLWQIFVRRG